MTDDTPGPKAVASAGGRGKAYPTELRDKATDLLLEGALSQREIAEKLKVPLSAVHNWARRPAAAHQTGPRRGPRPTAPPAAIEALRLRVAALEAENSELQKIVVDQLIALRSLRST